MNLDHVASLEARRITDRLRHVRQPIPEATLVELVREVFAAGVLYGIERSQHALAIARTAALAEHPLDHDEPFNEGVAYGIERAQKAVTVTHETALAQAVPP